MLTDKLAQRAKAERQESESAGGENRLWEGGWAAGRDGAASLMICGTWLRSDRRLSWRHIS